MIQRMALATSVFSQGLTVEAGHSSSNSYSARTAPASRPSPRPSRPAGPATGSPRCRRCVSTLIGRLTKTCGLGLVYVKVCPFGVVETAAYGNDLALPPCFRDRRRLDPEPLGGLADSVTAVEVRALDRLDRGRLSSSHVASSAGRRAGRERDRRRAATRPTATTTEQSLDFPVDAHLTHSLLFVGCPTLCHCPSASGARPGPVRLVLVCSTVALRRSRLDAGPAMQQLELGRHGRPRGRRRSAGRAPARRTG